MQNNTQGRRSLMIVGAVVVALSIIALEPPNAQRNANAEGVFAGPKDGQDGSAGDQSGENGSESDIGEGTGPGGGGVGGGPSGPTGAKGGAAVECKAGLNGGATDKGVTGDRIKLAATNVRSGTGSSFLGTAYIGMQAVVNRVNAKGGVCGRLLDLRLVDDGWDAARGANFLQNFAKGDYFAMPVVPSSEGLTQAILNGSIASSGVPVVGSDGMLKEQYSDPWVWPVATATVSTMRIMAKHAHDKGAKTFGIVYDTKYKFGAEGAAAFREYVKQLTGSPPKADIGITPGKPSYSGDANAFNNACGADGCDFVAMLLDPTTANVYISSNTDKNGKRQGFGRLMTGGAQPLFNERFARDCGKPCDGMLVWTGYNPPVGGLASLPDVAEYVNDVRSVDPGVDVNNQFLEGAYLGMKVFIEALEKTGPRLTRAGLKQNLNSMTFQSDLSSPLTWAPNQRFANQGAQAFRIVTAAGSFAGFADAGTSFIKDPTPGVVPK